MRLQTAIATGVVGRPPAPPPWLRVPITPLGLDLALGALTVEAVSALGFLGTHGLLTDGVLKGTGPTIAAAAPVTVVTRWRRDSIPNPEAIFAGLWTSATSYMRVSADRFSNGITSLYGSSVTKSASAAGAGSGYNTQTAIVKVDGANALPASAVDGSAVASTTGGVAGLGTATIYYASYRAASASEPAPSGLYMLDQAYFIGQELAEADLDALWNSGTRTDMLAIATSRGLTLAPYYDPSNAVAVGSTLEIPDITGTYGPIVISSADLGDLVEL